MKKVTFILALGVAITLTACGSGSTATQTTDSTAVDTVLGKSYGDETSKQDTSYYKNISLENQAKKDSAAK